MTSNERETGSVPQSRLPILSLTALGIVFGDIGTNDRMILYAHDFS